jgi:hypothetical protein
VSGNTGNGKVTFTYKVKGADDSTYTATVPSAKGRYTVKAVIAETDNYLGGSATADFKIADVAARVLTAPAAKTGLVYSGSPQELVTAGEASGGTMYYALGTATEATEQYTTSIPTGINAGTYYVWYMVKGNDNYADTKPDKVEVKIKEADSPSGGGGTGGGGGAGGGAAPTPAPTATPTQAPTPEPTEEPTPEPTAEPLPTPAPDPAKDVDPTADLTADKTVKSEETTEENGVKTTTQENTDGSKTTIVEDTNTNTKTTTVEETDGTKNIQTITEDADGTKTETGRTEQENGNFIEKTITTLPDGQTTETTASKTKNEDGSVTTTEGVKAADGTSTSLEKTEQTNGDFEQTYIAQDETGKVTEAQVSSKTTDPETNNVTEKKEIRDAEGNKEETVISKEASGSVTGVSVKETDSSGKSTESSFDAGKDNTLILSEVKTDGTTLEIPAAITGLNGESYPVTEIGKDALKGQQVEKVIIPETVDKIDAGALKDCGITEIHISGDINKGLLGKDALAGNGTGKKGRGLTFTVDSKKDAKKLSKQLKKAGVPKAKVKINK